MIPDRFPGSPQTMLLSTRASAFSIAVCVALGGLAGPAAGAENARAATAAKPPEQRVLTPAQLKDCIDQKARLQAQTDTALKTKAEIATEKDDVDRTGTAITDDLAALDRTSADAVDAHNAKVDERDKRIDAYQARVTAFNIEAESVRVNREAYAKSCENRRYDERDLPVPPPKRKK